MSVNSKNRLAAAVTVLAVLGLLAAMQVSQPAPTTVDSRQELAGDYRHQTDPRHVRHEGLMVEYR